IVYGLADKGAGTLAKRHSPAGNVGRLFLEHALLVSDVMVAIQVACRNRKRSVAFAELTPQFIKEEVSNALAEVVGLLLDPDVLKEFLKPRTPRPGTGGGGRRNLDPL